MLENQLLLCSRFEQQRKLVETLDSAEQLGAIHKINGYGRLLAPCEIQKTILYVLWRLL